MTDHSPTEQEIYLMLRCPSCARRHEVKPRFLGRTIDCQRCGESFVLQSETNARKFRARKQRMRKQAGKLIRNLNSLEQQNEARKRIVVSPIETAQPTQMPSPSKDSSNAKMESKIAQLPKQPGGDQRWIRIGMFFAVLLFAGAFFFYGYRLFKERFPDLGATAATTVDAPRKLPATEQMAMHNVDTESTPPKEALSVPKAISFLGFETSELSLIHI